MSKTPPDAYWTSTPKEGIRDNGTPLIYSTTPDVCKTPIGSSTPPIPYSITSNPADDASYTGSVKFTKQKVMVLRSNTTCCTGDEPGSAKGVKSGTVTDICEPIEHSSTVRAEGSHIIRHGDKFHMNKKNTVGLVSWVEDTTAQGNQHIKTVQLAQAQQASVVPGASPASSPTSPAGTAPKGPGQVIKGPWKTPPPRPAPPPQVPPWVGVATSIIKRSPLGLLSSVGGSVPIHQKYLGWYQSTVQNDAEQQVLDHARELLDPSDHEYNTLVAEWAGQELEALREEVQADDAEAREPGVASSPANVRVSGQEEEDDEKEKCIIGPYEDVAKICPNEAHHIIPDRVYRIGKRPTLAAEKSSTDNRIPNAPTFNQGMSICLNSDDHRLGNASTDIDLEGDEPSVHSTLDPAITALGHLHDPRGTAPIEEILEASQQALTKAKGISPECKLTAQNMTEAQVAHMLDQPGRTTFRPPRSRRVIETLESGTY